MESLGMSPGALPSAGLVFQLVCHFHRYWAYSSKSTVWPKMESCFHDRACSVSSFKIIWIALLPRKESWQTMAGREIRRIHFLPLLYSEQFLLSVFKSPIQVSESTLFSNFNYSQQDIYETHVILSSLCNGRIPAKKCRENGKIIETTIFIILNYVKEDSLGLTFDLLQLLRTCSSHRVSGPGITWLTE